MTNNTMKLYVLECKVYGEWKVLLDSPSKPWVESAADFMRRAQPEPDSVRIVETETEKSEQKP